MVLSSATASSHDAHMATILSKPLIWKSSLTAVGSEQTIIRPRRCCRVLATKSTTRRPALLMYVSPLKSRAIARSSASSTDSNASWNCCALDPSTRPSAPAIRTAPCLPVLMFNEIVLLEIADRPQSNATRRDATPRRGAMCATRLGPTTYGGRLRATRGRRRRQRGRAELSTRWQKDPSVRLTSYATPPRKCGRGVYNRCPTPSGPRLRAAC